MLIFLNDLFLFDSEFIGPLVSIEFIPSVMVLPTYYWKNSYFILEGSSLVKTNLPPVLLTYFYP